MSGWREQPLGELIDLFDSKRVPLSAAKRSTRQGPYPYYGAQSVIDHIDDYIFEGRYILIPEDGENLNSRKLPIAYFAEGKFWVNNHAHIAKAKSGVAVDRFVQSALESTDISGFVTGAAQPKLSQANLLRIPILAPSFEEQQRVGQVLDAIDDLIENNRRRVELLEQMAQVIYREWFVHFRYPGHEHDELGDSPLGPIPSGWAIAKLSDFASALVDGDWVETKDQGGSAYRLLQVSNISVGRFRETGNVRCVSAEAFGRLRCTAIQEGDILISRMPDPIGRAWLVTGLKQPSITAVDVAILTPCDGSVADYLSLFLNSPETLQHAETVATGTTRKRVTRSVLSQFELVRPPDDVLRSFQALVEPSRRLAAQLLVASDHLVDIRDLLLPKLVTGQIDVSKLDLDAVLGGAGV